jgi:hypothetical protein
VVAADDAVHTAAAHPHNVAQAIAAKPDPVTPWASDQHVG